MVKNTSNTTIAISLLAAFGLLLFVIYKLQPPKYNWKETYNKDIKKQPYATGMIYELLQEYFPKQEFTAVKKSIVEEVDVDGEMATNYLFIGNQFYLNPEETEHLLSYVNKGNQIFISAKDFPESFIEELYQSDCSSAISNEDNSLTGEELEDLFKKVINNDSLDVVFKELDEWEENPPSEFTEEIDLQEENKDYYEEEEGNMGGLEHYTGAVFSFWDGVEFLLPTSNGTNNSLSLLTGKKISARKRLNFHFDASSIQNTDWKDGNKERPKSNERHLPIKPKGLINIAS